MMTLNSMNPFSRTVAVAGALLALFLLAGTSDATINSSLQMQLGNPTSATVNPTNRSNYLVTRTVEALDFCDLLGVPRWASWDLTGSDIGSATRSSYFYTDTSLPSAFYRVKTADYTNSGYDRGHLCPSQDRTDTTANNKLVFFMSNITAVRFKTPVNTADYRRRASPESIGLGKEPVEWGFSRKA